MGFFARKRDIFDSGGAAQYEVTTNVTITGSTTTTIKTISGTGIFYSLIAHCSAQAQTGATSPRIFIDDTNISGELTVQAMEGLSLNTQDTYPIKLLFSNGINGEYLYQFSYFSGVAFNNSLVFKWTKTSAGDISGNYLLYYTLY